MAEGKQRQSAARRIILGLISACLILTIAACGSSNTAEGEQLKAGLKTYDGLSSLGLDEFNGINMTAEVNNGTPFITNDELPTEMYVRYGSLDSQDRPTGAVMCADKDTIHSSGFLTSITEGIAGFFDGSLAGSDYIPAGYNTTKYEYLNGQQLWGINEVIPTCLKSDSCDENLITITASCMETAYNTVSDTTDYMKDTDNHIVYRFTPVYETGEPIARGILIEARSVETSEVSVCTFVYNAERGMEINYEDGTAEVTGLDTEEIEEILDGIDLPDEFSDFTINDDDTITYTDEDGNETTASIDEIIDGLGDTLIGAQDVIQGATESVLGLIDKYGESFWDMAKAVGEHGAQINGVG